MLTVEQIRLQLQDRNISRVSRQTGVSRPTLIGILQGKTTPKDFTVKALSDYLEAQWATSNAS